jgi:hypothetical protein
VAHCLINPATGENNARVGDSTEKKAEQVSEEVMFHILLS